MRWVSGIILAGTIVTVAVLGLTPTSFGISNGLPDIVCRSALAPITGAGLINDDEVPWEVVEPWLLDVGYVDDNGNVSNDDLYEASIRGGELCDDARAGRVGTMLLVAVVGFGLSAAPVLLTRRKTADAA